MAISKAALSTLRVVERSARFMMGGVAITAALVGLSHKAGLISTAPNYDRQSWYLITEHPGFTVTKQLNDEMDCRKHETEVSICRSGIAMMDQPSGSLVEGKHSREMIAHIASASTTHRN